MKLFKKKSKRRTYNRMNGVDRLEFQIVTLVNYRAHKDARKTRKIMVELYTDMYPGVPVTNAKQFVWARVREAIEVSDRMDEAGLELNVHNPASFTLTEIESL